LNVADQMGEGATQSRSSHQGSRLSG
jgi:hypothetical protein